jgi:hypothetical protein
MRKHCDEDHSARQQSAQLAIDLLGLIKFVAGPLLQGPAAAAGQPKRPDDGTAGKGGR